MVSSTISTALLHITVAARKRARNNFSVETIKIIFMKIIEFRIPMSSQRANN